MCMDFWKITHKLLATMIMLGARGLPEAQQPHVQRHARTKSGYWINLAKDHVRADVKLLPEPTTIEGVKLAMTQ